MPAANRDPAPQQVTHTTSLPTHTHTHTHTVHTFLCNSAQLCLDTVQLSGHKFGTHWPIEICTAVTGFSELMHVLYTYFYAYFLHISMRTFYIVYAYFLDISMRNFYIFLCVLSTYAIAYFLHFMRTFFIFMHTFCIFLCVLSTYFYAYFLNVSMRNFYIRYA